MDADMFDRGGPMEGERFGGEAIIPGEGKGYGRGGAMEDDRMKRWIGRRGGAAKEEEQMQGWGEVLSLLMCL